MKLLKRCAALAGSLLVWGAMAVSGVSAAHSTPDAAQTGSISAAMTYEDQAVGGGSLTLYRVGDVTQDDGNYSFTLSEAFADSGVSLEDITAASLADTLAAYAEENALEGSTVDISEDGTWTASGLELGLYLIVQNDPADGFEAISPFLVSVPMYDEETGAYVYDVNAQPKLGTLTETETTTPTPSTSTSTDTTLPQTGQLNWPVPVLTVAGLCLLLAGWWLHTGNKRKAHEG